MSINLSKQKRDNLIKKIKLIREKLAADKGNGELLTYLSDLEKEIKAKKYGLVFEEHQEKIDEILAENTPVLTEDKDLFIDHGGEMNFLIEGDNLASLQLLEKTHKGKIDVIIIDPPYNTGTNDFMYDDSYIGKDDLFKHSKWLSFIKKRLKIAKELLSTTGMLFINIDDNECTVLRALCEDMFSNQNVEYMIWRKSGDGRDGKMKNTTTFRIDHEYIVVCYKKNKKLNKIIEKPNFQGNYCNADNDPRGNWMSGSLSRTEKASNPKHSNYYTVISPTGVEFTRQFDISKSEFEELNAQGKISWGKKNNSIPRMKVFIDEERIVTPYSMLLSKGTTTEGTKELNDLLNGDCSRLRPKPSILYKTLIQLGSKKDSFILDFFAGSGTTGQATMLANRSYGGKRKFILCTNNENNICRDVTYERIKRVIDKEKYDASLKYFKVDFVPISEKLYYEYADQLLKHIKELVELENGINFDGNEKIAIILTDEELKDFTDNLDQHKKCKKIYLGHDVLPSGEQETLLQERQIAVNVIPDYYYRELEG